MIERSTDIGRALSARDVGRLIGRRGRRALSQRGFIIDPFHAAPASPDVHALMFEGTNGAQSFVDTGNPGGTWTASSGDIHLTTADKKQGSAALAIDNALNNLSTPYGSGNAITTGNAFIGFWLCPFGSSAQLASKYAVAVEDATGTAAGSAFIFATNASRVMNFYASNGTTRTSTSGGSALSSGTWVYVAAEWHSGTWYFSMAGTVVGSFAFAGPLNLPSSKTITMGASPGGSGLICYVDQFQLRRNSINAGGNFTPPTNPFS